MKILVAGAVVFVGYYIGRRLICLWNKLFCFEKVNRYCWILRQKAQLAESLELQRRSFRKIDILNRDVFGNPDPCPCIARQYSSDRQVRWTLLVGVDSCVAMLGQGQ